VKRRGFDEFYLDTMDRCFGAVLATVGDLGEADDLLAEAYTRAWGRWNDVSTHAAPRVMAPCTTPRSRRST
jgi:RNA polymerase sigma-70 factor (ECF subfamily)